MSVRPVERTDYIRFVQSVDWENYSTAYEELSVRRLLIEAVDHTDESRLSQVVASVCHQGVLSEAAPHVARALTMLLQIDVRLDVLHSLAFLAEAAWLQPLRIGVAPRRRLYEGRIGISEDVSLRHELAYEARSQAIVDQVGNVATTLAQVITSLDDPYLSLLALFLMSLAPPEDPAIFAKLMANGRLSRSVAAGVCLAAAQSPVSHLQIIDLGRFLVESEQSGTRSCAIAALLLVDASATHIELDQIIDHLLIDPTVDEDFPWCGGSPAGLIANALAESSLSDEVVARTLLRALHRWKEQPEDWEEMSEGTVADQLGERLFERLFRTHLGRRDYIISSELSPLQREVLQDLDGLEPPFLGLTLPQACGFRDLWTDRDRLLGRSQGALDRLLQDTWCARTVTWPVWKWYWHLHDAAHHGFQEMHSELDAKLARVLQKNLQINDVIAVLQDATEGSYAIDPAALAAFLIDEEVAISALEQLERHPSWPDSVTATMAAALATRAPPTIRALWVAKLISLQEAILSPSLRTLIAVLAKG